VAEVDALRDFVAAAATGPRAILVEGQAGIGKTILWRELLASAGDRAVLATQAAEAEMKLSFAALGDLFAGASDGALASLPKPQRRAFEVALGLAEPGSAGVEQRLVSLALLGAVRALAADRPLLLAVDDCQWLDPPSAEALHFALRRLEQEPVGVAVTLRSGQAEPLELERAFEERAERLHVGPLSLEELDLLLRTRLDAGFRRPTLLRLERISGGNPFYALELGRALLRRDADAAADELPIPPSLKALVRERIGALGPEARDALLLAAAAVRPERELFDPAGVEEAVRAGVLELEGETVRPAHPLLGSVLYAETPLERRRELHRRLADATVEPEERARHLGVAADGPDEAVAAALDDAAGRARARGAPGAAAELAEQALRLTGEDPAAAHRRRLVAAHHWAAAGDPDRARALAEAALAAAPPGRSRAEALHQLGELVGSLEGLHASESIHRRALAEARGDDTLRAAIELSLARLSILTEGPARSLPHATAALELAERTGDASLLVGALIAVAWARYQLGEGVQRELLERAIAAGPPLGFRTDQHPRAALAWQQFDSRQQIAEARTNFEAVLAEAEEAADAATYGLYFYLADVATWDDDLRRLEEYADLAYQAGMQSGHLHGELFGLAARVLYELDVGAFDQAREDIARLTALGERSSEHHLNLAKSLTGRLEFLRGNFREAERSFGSRVSAIRERGIVTPSDLGPIREEIEALVELGELEQARELTALFEQEGAKLRPTWTPPLAARARGLIAAAAGDLERAEEELTAAVAGRDSVAPLPQGENLLALGSVRRRRQQRRAARETLEEALVIFERLGARPFAERARAELARIGGRPTAAGGLTATEQRIAELVAAGRSNAEVANQLVVSPRTVEWNLSKIYRKLRVRSRAELTAKLRP
jgi:DNA-binding CsgD family transcriptional regulator